MSDPPRPPSRPPGNYAPIVPRRDFTRPVTPKSASGKHPAVVEYRRKLQSIADGADEADKALDANLETYLESIRPFPVDPRVEPEEPAEEDATPTPHEKAP